MSEGPKTKTKQSKQRQHNKPKNKKQHVKRTQKQQHKIATKNEPPTQQQNIGKTDTNKRPRM